MKKIALVLPGGGVRGIQQHCILSVIDKELSKLIQDYKGLSNYVDYFAGTSIGALGVVHASVCNGDGNTYNSFDDGINIFLENAGNVLSQKPSNYLASALSLLPSWGITEPYYSNEMIKNILSGIVSEKTVGDNILKGKFLITSYCLNHCEPTIWTNIGTEEQRSKINYCVKNIDQIKLQDIVTASASVPVLLPAHEIEYQRHHEKVLLHEIDGGFVSNTPVLDLISCISRLEKVNLSDLFVLSVGTGKFSRDFTHLKNAGFLSYSKNFPNVIASHINAVQEHNENIAKQLIEAHGGKFASINISMPVTDFANAINDSLDSMHYYKSMSDDFIKENQELLQNIAHELADWINSNS